MLVAKAGTAPTIQITEKNIEIGTFPLLPPNAQ